MTLGRELLDTSLGHGDVHDTTGHLVGVGQYELHLFREAHKDPAGKIHQFEEIEGVISGLDAGGRVGEPLVLTLEDGRKLDFAFQNSEGTITARGDFRR